MKPYEGEQPYLFISYAHANSPAVLEILRDMGARGYRLWYDDGIEVGSEWPEYIASHLARAQVMIAFISNAYMRSDNCRKEMHFALSRRIPVISIFLEDTPLSPGMEMQLGNIFALMKYSMREESFYDKLYAAPQLGTELIDSGAAAPSARRRSRARRKVPLDLTVEARRQKKQRIRRLVALSVLLALLAATVTLAVIGYFSGTLERLFLRREQAEITALSGESEAVFLSPLLERAARDYSGIETGALHVSDLAGLSELYVLGGDVSLEAPDETRRAAALAEEGSLDSLADLRYFTDLRTLHLIGQPLASLETLPVCGIEYLDVSGCRLTSLAGIARLPRLRELAANGCPLSDLGDLGRCLQLRLLSLLDTHVTDFTSLKPLTKLADFRVSHSSTRDLRTVFQLDSLTSVSLYDCDLRGSFFKAFDRERSLVSLSLTDCKLDSTANLDDFRGLTTLSLIRTGERLNWSDLAALPALKTVYADPVLAETLESVLAGTAVNVLPAESAA